MLKTVFTCEHGGNQIPDAYKEIFKGFEHVLTTFKAYDIGAMSLFKDLLEETGNYSNYFPYCRLLVDVDKSLDNPDLFSQAMIRAPEAARQKVLKDFYKPWRKDVEQNIALLMKDNHVIHCSVHTFPNTVNEELRKLDVAVLYDENRASDKFFAEHFLNLLSNENPRMQIEANYDIPGGKEGFVSQLRAKRGFAKNYTGIQLEVSQSFPLGKSDKWIDVRRSIVNCYKASLKEFKLYLQQ